MAWVDKQDTKPHGDSIDRILPREQRTPDTGMQHGRHQVPKSRRGSSANHGATTVTFACHVCDGSNRYVRAVVRKKDINGF